jgi:hypothetical protein
VVFAVCTEQGKGSGSTQAGITLNTDVTRGEGIPVPDIIDPVFTKTSQNARFLLSENERFGLVFVKTGSINSGTEYEGSLKDAMCTYVNNCGFAKKFAEGYKGLIMQIHLRCEFLWMNIANLEFFSVIYFPYVLLC